jgi:hypothetical protein
MNFLPRTPGVRTFCLRSKRGGRASEYFKALGQLDDRIDEKVAMTAAKSRRATHSV